jgi:hypothetical protein
MRRDDDVVILLVASTDVVPRVLSLRRFHSLPRFGQLGHQRRCRFESYLIRLMLKDASRLKLATPPPRTDHAKRTPLKCSKIPTCLQRLSTALERVHRAGAIVHDLESRQAVLDPRDKLLTAKSTYHLLPRKHKDGRTRSRCYHSACSDRRLVLAIRRERYASA